MFGRSSEFSPMYAPNNRVGRITEFGSIFRHGIQNGLNISRGAGDDAKNLACCCLLFQGFAQFFGSRSLLLPCLGEFAIACFKFLA